MTPHQSISTIKDVRIIEARAINSTSGRKHIHKCLLEGEKVLYWAFHSLISIERIFYHHRIVSHPLFSLAEERDIEMISVSEGILRKITDTSYLIPWVGVARLPHESFSGKGNLALLIDGICDHGNIGTIFRTGRAFNVQEIIATSPAFDAYYRKTIESSRGTIFHIQMICAASVQEAVKTLKSFDYQIVATSPYGTTLQSRLQLDVRRVALAVGNESEGVSEELLGMVDHVIQIPMSISVDSLNVGVATGISLYEIRFKQVLLMLTKYIRNTLGREVNVAAKLIQQAFDKRIQSVSPYTSTQLIMMMVLKCDERMSLTQMSKDSGIWGEDLEKIIQPLLEEQFLSQNHEGLFRLTEKGEQLLAQYWPVVEASEEQILEGFSDTEKTEFLSYIKRIQSNSAGLISG